MFIEGKVTQVNSVATKTGGEFFEIRVEDETAGPCECVYFPQRGAWVPPKWTDVRVVIGGRGQAAQFNRFRNAVVYNIGSIEPVVLERVQEVVSKLNGHGPA